MKKNTERLTKIFLKTFQMEKTKVEAASINNTKNWNSLSHMNLMISISYEFPTKKITDTLYPKLISFKTILQFLNKSKKN